MSFMNLRLLAIVIALLFTSQVFGQDPDYVRHFDYDKTASLELTTVGTEKRGDVTVYDVTYASPKGGVVPAYIVVPKGKGKFAGVVWGHWYWANSPMRNRKEFSMKR